MHQFRVTIIVFQFILSLLNCQIIDQFDEYDPIQYPYYQNQTYQTDSTILGGERDVFMEGTFEYDGYPENTLFIALYGGIIDIFWTMGTSQTSVIIQYDGTDNNIDLNPNGINTDLTQLGNAFEIMYISYPNQDYSFNTRVYSGSTVDYCQFTSTVAQTEDTNFFNTTYIPFNSNEWQRVGNGCDFSNVGAIELEIPNNVDHTHMKFDYFGVTNVFFSPSPSRSPSPIPLPTRSPTKTRTPTPVPYYSYSETTDSETYSTYTNSYSSSSDSSKSSRTSDESSGGHHGNNDDQSSGPPLGAILGIIFGIIAFVIVIVCVCWFIVFIYTLCYKCKSEDKDEEEVPENKKVKKEKITVFNGVAQVENISTTSNDSTLRSETDFTFSDLTLRSIP